MLEREAISKKQAGAWPDPEQKRSDCYPNILEERGLQEGGRVQTLCFPEKGTGIAPTALAQTQMCSPVILNLFHFIKCTSNTFTSKSQSNFKRIFSHSFLANTDLKLYLPHPCASSNNWLPVLPPSTSPSLMLCPICHEACLLVALSHSCLLPSAKCS